MLLNVTKATAVSKSNVVADPTYGRKLSTAATAPHRKGLGMPSSIIMAAVHRPKPKLIRAMLE